MRGEESVGGGVRREGKSDVIRFPAPVQFMPLFSFESDATCSYQNAIWKLLSGWPAGKGQKTKPKKTHLCRMEAKENGTTRGTNHRL